MKHKLKELALYAFFSCTFCTIGVLFITNPTATYINAVPEVVFAVGVIQLVGALIFFLKVLSHIKNLRRGN